MDHASAGIAGLQTIPVTTPPPDFRPGVGEPETDTTGIILYVMNVELVGTTDDPADTFSGLLAAIEKRHDDFARAGCRATDHGIEFLPDVDATEAEARAVWERAMAGTAATAAERAQKRAQKDRHDPALIQLSPFGPRATPRRERP